MPCSRSAARPSTRRLKSGVPAAVLALRSMAARWSVVSASASHSMRPIRVDLPSSTEPQVRTWRLPAGSRPGAAASTAAASGSRTRAACGRRSGRAFGESLQRAPPSEVALLLLALHAADIVVVDEAALALGHAGRQRLLDHAVEIGGVGSDRRRQRPAAERAEAHALASRPARPRAGAGGRRRAPGGCRCARWWAARRRSRAAPRRGCSRAM